MKKRIVEYVFALLIVVVIVSQYINTIWPYTIPVIDGLFSFWLILLFGVWWLLWNHDESIRLRHVALIILADICLVIAPTYAISTYFEKKDKTIRIGYIPSKEASSNTKGGTSYA